MAPKGGARAQGAIQVKGVALHHMHAGKARGQVAGKVLVIFQQGQILRRNAARQDRSLTTPVPGPISSTGPAAGIDLAGDGLGQSGAGRKDRADVFGTGDQSAQEAQIVGKGRWSRVGLALGLLAA